MNKFFTMLAVALVFGSVSAQRMHHESDIDLLTDQDTSYVLLQSTGFIRNSDDHATLVVRCTSSGYEVFFATEAFLGSGGRDDRIDVAYRFGTEQAVSARWGSSTSSMGAFLTAAEREPFLRQVFQHEQLVVRFTDYRDRHHTVVFTLPVEFRDYVNRLACVPNF